MHESDAARTRSALCGACTHPHTHRWRQRLSMWLIRRAASMHFPLSKVLSWPGFTTIKAHYADELPLSIIA